MTEDTFTYPFAMPMANRLLSVKDWNNVHDLANLKTLRNFRIPKIIHGVGVVLLVKTRGTIILINEP